MTNGDETRVDVSTLGDLMNGDILATGRMGGKFLFGVDLFGVRQSVFGNTFGSFMLVFFAIPGFVSLGVNVALVLDGAGCGDDVLWIIMALIFCTEYLGSFLGDFLQIVLFFGLSK